MDRDEIYDHLAQVYLGKRKQVKPKKSKQFNVWLLINVMTTVLIFASVFFGMTAFFSHKRPALKDRIVYSLSNGAIRIGYDFNKGTHPKEQFSLSIPDVDATKYSNLNFAIRSKEEGTPGVVKIIVSNSLNEEAYYYVQGVGMDWVETSIPLDEFKQITDWSRLTNISFVIESWNVDDKTGVVLIDDVCFSGVGGTKL